MKLLNSPRIPAWTGVLMLNSGASSASSGALGTVLRGAGAGVMPTWGAVSLTADVSGDLPFANIAQIATNRLVGRQASGTGDIEALSVASNNGMAFDWATAGTLKISTPQDLQTSATPTFSRLTLSVATGTAPLTISSTTVCTNLNADLLDGQHGSDYAAASHKYHTFSNGQYFYDSYDQANYFRCWTENALGDNFRFKTPSSVEYWDGGAWVAWSGGDTIIKSALDGMETTYASIDHTHKKFRFQLTRATGWPLGCIFMLQTVWSAIAYTQAILTVEHWDGGAWVSKVSATFGNGTSGNNWGSHAYFSTNVHDGYTLCRVTVDITDWTDSGGYVTYPIVRIGAFSNYAVGATQLRPWSWDFDKKVTFAGAIAATGIVTGTQISSTVSTGTSPLSITSTTVCTNLNADMVDGLHAPITGNNGNTWGHVATVKSDGVMEVGRYVDFHHTSNDGADYAVRLSTDGSTAVLSCSGALYATKLYGSAGIILATTEDISARVESGFHQATTATTGEGWPSTTNSYMLMLGATHSNTANYYAFQLAADMFTQNFWARVTNNSGATAWSRIPVCASAGLTQYGVVCGGGTGAITATGAGSLGQLLIGQTSANPAWSYLSGDGSLSGVGVLTIASNAVSLAKMADIATNRLLGRQAASTGDPEVLTLGSNNGVAFDWATAGTLKISTPQNLQTSAAPSFLGISLGHTAGLGAIAATFQASGDGGPRLLIANSGALLWDDGLSSGYDLMLAPSMDPDTLTLTSANGNTFFAADHFTLNPAASQGSENELTNDTGRNALWVNTNGVGGWVQKVLWTQYANVTVASTTAETTLISGSGVGTRTLSSGYSRQGKTLRVKACGYLSTAAGSQTITLRIKFGSTVLGTWTGSVANSTSYLWTLEAEVLCTTTGASGNMRTMGTVMLQTATGVAAANMIAPSSLPTDATVNTTASQTLDVTAQWGNTSTSITCTHLTIEHLV